MSERSEIGNIWVLRNGESTKIGFTRSFINSLNHCWHIMPGNVRQVKEKSPLLAIESHEGLISVPSPVTGNVVFWNDKASNFPEKLTEEDVIVEIGAGTAMTPNIRTVAHFAEEDDESVPFDEPVDAPRRPRTNAELVQEAVARLRRNNEVDIVNTTATPNPITWDSTFNTFTSTRR